MLVTRALYNCAESPETKQPTDHLDLQWYESTKRIQRRRTRAGVEVAIRFLGQGQDLLDGDVLFEDEQSRIVVNLLETKAIVVHTSSLQEIGLVCYEIGNKHIPLFLQDDTVLLPFEAPMFRWLENHQYQPEIKMMKLTNRLDAKVNHHQRGRNRGGLRSKISLKLDN